MGRSKRSRDDEEEEDEEFREEDQDQERESSAQKRKKKKNKKGKKEKQYEEVMKGQTEEERRQLRRAQRKVEAEIIEKAPELLDPNNRTFDELHDKNDELFKQTKFPREATIDAGNMLKLMRLRGKRMESMQGEVQTFSTKKFVNKLAERGQDEVGFHWSDLGMATTICFHGVPPVSFLLGVLGRPPKAKAARKGKDNAAAHVEKINNNERVTMQEMDQSQNKEKKKDTTEARLKKLTALLTGKDANCRKAVAVAKNEDGKLDMMRLVLNPKSFTQTVENMFDLSFFAKIGELTVQTEDDDHQPLPFPLVDSVQPPEGHQPNRQMVVSLSMADWREMVEAYGEDCEPVIADRHIGAAPHSTYFDPLAHVAE